MQATADSGTLHCGRLSGRCSRTRHRSISCVPHRTFVFHCPPPPLHVQAISRALYAGDATLQVALPPSHAVRLGDRGCCVIIEQPTAGHACAPCVELCARQWQTLVDALPSIHRSCEVQQF
jgi:hypothetical protein